MADQAFRYQSISELRDLVAQGQLQTILSARHRGSSNRSALHYAAFDGKLDRVKFLVEELNFPVTVQMGNGDTPLHEAIRCPQPKLSIISYLLAKQQRVQPPNLSHLINLALQCQNRGIERFRSLEEWVEDVSNRASVTGYLIRVDAAGGHSPEQFVQLHSPEQCHHRRGCCRCPG